LGELRFERCPERIRQHYHAILATLAIPNEDHLPIEIDILDAQLQSFQQPQAGSV
jgi:hypothetical protein